MEPQEQLFFFDKWSDRIFCSWDGHFLSQLFGQLTNQDSLYDLSITFEAHGKKTYLLGLGKSIT
ncbi:DUF4372 domain-containing protein [Pedobacter sp. AK013]|uniref:DUF4372 domain-containing protein n=1 Tax=Pedobacter sp. AK013 TaxID=2723071 RepID=UPI00351C32B6